MHLQSYCKDANACPGGFHMQAKGLAARACLYSPVTAAASAHLASIYCLISSIAAAPACCSSARQRSPPLFMYLQMYFTGLMLVQTSVDMTVQELTQQRVVGINPLIPKAVRPLSGLQGNIEDFGMMYDCHEQPQQLAASVVIDVANNSRNKCGSSG